MARDVTGKTMANEQKVVVFRLEKELYGFDIESVERILNETSVTPLPRTPKTLLGIFELRGVTLPVLDLRRRFEMAENATSGSFVITQTPSGRVALRVDRVEGILTVDQDHVEPQPDAWVDREDPFIGGIAKTELGLVALLNADHIVPKNLRGKVGKIEQKAA